MRKFLARAKRLWEIFTVRVPEARGAFNEADGILVQSFGLREVAGTKEPGPMNEMMGRVLVELSQNLTLKSLPIATQWEVADSLAISLAKMPVACRVDKHRIPGEYLDTREVLEQEAEYARAADWEKVIVIAHYRHLQRCVWAAERLDLEVVIPSEVLNELHSKVNFYDRQGAQSWTRSSARWEFYELIARLIYFLRGWI